EGDEKWFLENEKTVTQFCRKLAAERPLKDIRDEYNYPKKKGIKDECSRLLEASTMKSRRGFAIQRLMNAMRQAHADGWFIVFDTLTLADDRLEAFYDNPNALRDYFRDIGRMVLAAEGRKANDSHADCYQYLCVPVDCVIILPVLLCIIFVILVVCFLLPRVARLMIHTPTAISIFVCLSMVQLMAVFISMRCTLCGHFLQVALTLILVVGYAIAAS